jgi:hypothetical protein
MVALLAGALLALTGCGGPGDAQTLQVFDAGVGVNDRDSDVYVLNALVVDNADSTGTLSVSLLDKSGDGDQLVAVEAATDAGEPIEVQQHVRPLELCDGNLEVVGPGAEVTLAGDNFAAGDVIELSFTFRDAEPVRMGVPVVSRITDVEGAINPYDSVAETPPAVPKPSDCTTATPTPTA